MSEGDVTFLGPVEVKPEMNVPETRQKDKIIDNAFRENFEVLLKSWESKQRRRDERKVLNRKKKS